MRYLCVVCSMVHIFSISKSFVEGFLKAKMGRSRSLASAQHLGSLSSVYIASGVCSMVHHILASASLQGLPKSHTNLRTGLGQQKLSSIDFPGLDCRAMFIIYVPDHLIHNQYLTYSPSLTGHPGSHSGLKYEFVVIAPSCQLLTVCDTHCEGVLEVTAS